MLPSQNPRDMTSHEHELPPRGERARIRFRHMTTDPGGGSQEREVYDATTNMPVVMQIL
jgi:hypothetical protein